MLLCCGTAPTMRAAGLLSLRLCGLPGALTLTPPPPFAEPSHAPRVAHGAPLLAPRSQPAIAEFGQARLSATQRDLLATAMRDVESVEAEGIAIGAVVLDTGRGFVTGMSAVAEELVQLLSFDVLLLGITHRNAKEQSFLSLIGRCSARAYAVDLNAVMGRYNGGGHPAAAAASLRLDEWIEHRERFEAHVARDDDAAGAAAVVGSAEGVHAAGAATAVASASAVEADDAKAARVASAAEAVLAEARQFVLEMLPEQPRAADLMTTTVFSCAPDDTMAEAMRLMNRLSKKAVPVADSEGKLQGMLKYRDVVKAAQAGKGEQQVKAWMRREIVTIEASAPLDKVEQVLIKTGSGRLPVIDESGHLLGLVTRTDVLRQHRMYGRLARSPRA